MICKNPEPITYDWSFSLQPEFIKKQEVFCFPWLQKDEWHEMGYFDVTTEAIVRGYFRKQLS